MALHKDIIERANARLGSVLKGKWRLDAVIGIGGLASDYAATHRNQARVAIKLLHPEVALDAEVTARFLREGYVANKVGHPGTVTVLDDDVTDDGAPFLVMELLLGQTLETMLALAPDGVAVHEVVPLLDQLLDVLAAAHDKGIVHRDLKPENLFLTQDGRLKVLDFGIARLRELSQPSPSATQAGSVLGTPAFMAPEQALGRWHEVDGRTDIWSVGATAFTLLTGRFVHEAQTVQEQLVLSATRPARNVRQVNANVPLGLAAVVDRALCFDRAQRFGHARVMRGALRYATNLTPLEGVSPGPLRIAESARVGSLADEHSATLIAPNAVQSAITGRVETAAGRPVTRSTAGGSRPPRRRSTLIMSVGALCLSVVGGAGLLFAMHRGPTEEAQVSSATSLPPTVPVLRPALSVPLPAVAPILDAASSSQVVPVVRAPAASTPPEKRVVRPIIAPSLPSLPSLPALPRPASTGKSLMGAENPFDRRH